MLSDYTKSKKDHLDSYEEGFLLFFKGFYLEPALKKETFFCRYMETSTIPLEKQTKKSFRVPDLTFSSKCVQRPIVYMLFSVNSQTYSRLI